MAKHRVIGVSFDHMHMGDLLRQVAEHPDAEIVAVFDPDRQRMQAAVAAFGIPERRVFTDLDACLAGTPADIAIVCSTTAEHARTVERLAPHGLDVMVEKPFAANAHEARRMIAALDRAGGRLAINWPLAWSPALNTAKRLVEEGAVGALIELHYYGGNRGPLFHLADKVEVSPEEVEAQKPTSWWYRKESGGGSLLDYLGYGATLGTWLLDGEAPIEVTAVVDETPGIEVDQHSVTVCRYRRGLSNLRDPVGHALRPVDAAAAAQNGLRAGRQRGQPLLLRLRAVRDAADADGAATGAHRGRAAAGGKAQRDRISAVAARRRGRRSTVRSTRRSASSVSASSTARCSRRPPSGRCRWRHERRARKKQGSGSAGACEAAHL